MIEKCALNALSDGRDSEYRSATASKASARRHCDWDTERRLELVPVLRPYALEPKSYLGRYRTEQQGSPGEKGIEIQPEQKRLLVLESVRPEGSFIHRLNQRYPCDPPLVQGNEGIA